MRSVFLGLGLQYDSGSFPSIAVSRSGRVVEVHKNELGLTLYSRVGQTNEMAIAWKPTSQYTTGVDPCVAMNNGNTCVEVHKNEAGTTLYYLVGQAGSDKVTWGPSRELDSGVTPGIALNDGGFAIEVHQTQNPFSDRLYYRCGPVQGDTVKWSGSHDFANGDNPRIDVNNSNAVVIVYVKDGKVRYRTGSANPNDKSVKFNDQRDLADGMRPAVALTDDGLVIVVYKVGESLYQRVGRVNGANIDWIGPAEYYDDGSYPSVSTASNIVVESHEGEVLKTLWYETSILTDRAIWMQERLPMLGGKTLSSLVLPASHDAAMYLGSGFSVFGKTQELSIYAQLEYGIRWFDLRPEYKANEDRFYLHHGPILGPSLDAVLDDIQRYCNWGHRELAILKLSHFDNIDTNTYRKMVQQISDKIGRWLVKSTPQGKRLADTTLNEFVANGPAMLVVVDGNYAIDAKTDGFWVYRDWESADPARGDLRVYDIYSDTISFSSMKTNQFEKFANYTGKCKNDPNVPCDMFLLSWTLTPPTFVWLAAKEPDRELGNCMTQLVVPNRYGKIVNMLYVDYSEFARVTDVAIAQNGERVPITASAAKARSEARPEATA